MVKQAFKHPCPTASKEPQGLCRADLKPQASLQWPFRGVNGADPHRGRSGPRPQDSVILLAHAMARKAFDYPPTPIVLSGFISSQGLAAYGFKMADGASSLAAGYVCRSVKKAPAGDNGTLIRKTVFPALPFFKEYRHFSARKWRAKVVHSSRCRIRPSSPRLVSWR